MADHEGEDIPADGVEGIPAEGGEFPEKTERPKGLLPRFVVVLTSVVLILVLSISPMNQTMVPQPTLSKTLPFERVDYAILAQVASKNGAEIDEVVLIAPARANADDLERLAQELKWESPEGPRLVIGLFSDARAAALYGRYFDGRATPEERAIFQAGFIGTVTRDRPDGPVTLDADLGAGARLRRQY